MTQTSTDILGTYTRSLDVLERAIRTADPARWDDQSPCADWTARQVAGHALNFLDNVVTLAADGPAPDFRAPIDLAARAGAHPGRAWTRVRHRLETDLLDRPDRLAAVRMTPLNVEMPVGDLLAYQGMDPLVHAWDIAVTTGAEIAVADDIAEHYLGQFGPLWDGLRERGALGPRTAPVGAGAFGELLGLCGRAG
jgi:uncharacterized protein (TIGR03086 family)